MPTPPSMSRRPTTSKLSPSDRRLAPEKQDPITPNTPTRITVPGTDFGNDHDEQERLPPVVEPSVSNSRSLSQEMMESSMLDKSIPLVEDPDLDDLWESIRQKKEKKMAKEQPKVQSLREPQEEEPIEEEFSQLEVPPPDIPRESTKPDSSQKRIKKQKSFTSFRESADGRELVAFIDVQGCGKEDVHVSYQRNRLIVTWWCVEYAEWEEDGCIVRERVINNFQRAFPLPEGTRFKEIRCALNGRHLVLKYPNSRSFRVENVTYDNRGSVRS